MGLASAFGDYFYQARVLGGETLHCMLPHRGEQRTGGAAFCIGSHRARPRDADGISVLRRADTISKVCKAKEREYASEDRFGDLLTLCVDSTNHHNNEQNQNLDSDGFTYTEDAVGWKLEE